MTRIILLFLIFFSLIIFISDISESRSKLGIDKAPVIFNNNFLINQMHEQSFDFYISSREKNNQEFSLGLEFWIPEWNQKIRDDFFDMIYEREKVDNLPKFSVVLEHHLGNGQIDFIPLTGVVGYSVPNSDGYNIQTFSKPPAKLVPIFEDAEKREDSDGKKYIGHSAPLTGIILNKISKSKEGFYRLKVTQLDKIELSPEIKVKVRVKYPVFHK